LIATIAIMSGLHHNNMMNSDELAWEQRLALAAAKNRELNALGRPVKTNVSKE
jgi:hypothetical protein